MLSLQSIAGEAETSAATQPVKEEQGAAIRERMQTVAKELGLTDDRNNS